MKIKVQVCLIFCLAFFVIINCSFKNKDVDLHVQLFIKIIQLKSNLKYQDTYLINDEYFMSNGGYGVITESLTTFSEVDSLNKYALIQIKDSLSLNKKISLLDSLPCNQCPFWHYAKSKVLRYKKNPQLSRYIEIGKPIEGWKSLIGIDEFIIVDELHKTAKLRIPVTTLYWDKSEPIVEMFLFEIKSENEKYKITFLKKVVL